MVQTVCDRVRRGMDLSFDEMADVLDAIMRGLWSEADTVELLAGLSQKGETVEEVAGAAATLRKHMTPIRSSRVGWSIRAARAETPRAPSTSAPPPPWSPPPPAYRWPSTETAASPAAPAPRTCSLELGVNIEAPVPVVERCLEEVGIAFCFAPQLHPSMRHVASARRKVGKPTIFNLLGPLCNPASAPFQLLGVGKRPAPGKAGRGASPAENDAGSRCHRRGRPR